jgi:hypothetical protein
MNLQITIAPITRNDDRKNLLIQLYSSIQKKITKQAFFARKKCDHSGLLTSDKLTIMHWIYICWCRTVVRCPLEYDKCAT